ncbi:FAD-binding oxidoreductase, partial [Streptomyces sp. OR43]|uniref:FAD-binding oxidoreductase n=1 Tax=Streptomyces sp. or43 TaxID=2478957 RepID=UPI0013A50BF1
PTRPFVPGQYVSVRVELPDGAGQIRQYSLSTAPGRDTWRFTVKRERSLDGQVPEGEVSTWLHAHARPGDTLQVSLPFGDLLLPEGSGPLMLASAGIGITPMLAMLEQLVTAAPDRPVTVVHADRSPAHHAHRKELHDLVDRLPNASLHLWYEDTADHPEADHVNEGWADITGLSPDPGTTAFLCGPLSFMKAVRTDLLAHGLSPKAIHYEVFGPDLWLSK